MSLRSAKNTKVLPWWRRPIDTTRLGIFGTRYGAMLLFMFVALLIENPWVIPVLGALGAAGLLALVIRGSNRNEPPSLRL